MKRWQTELKAEELTTSQMDSWLAGNRPRGILVIPFSGPLPGGKAGLDLDGEYFDADTDLYGSFDTLRQTRHRLVDWHHDVDPTGVMKGAILGRIELDEKASDDGHWAAFWANAGEKRRELMARLESAGVPLFGSSQAVTSGVRKASDGRIEVWPLIRHTITTSPQNTHAVVPAIKGLLAIAGVSYDAVSASALKAALLADESTLSTLPSEAGERSGERSQLSPRLAAMLDEALDTLTNVLPRL